MRLNLQPHPDFASTAVDEIAIDVRLSDPQWLQLHYVVTGAVDSVMWPERGDPKRADRLWQNTCFEAFIGISGQAHYLEFNWSPSHSWAAYEFDDHRSGMRNLPMRGAPKIFSNQEHRRYCLSSTIDLSQFKVIRRKEQLDLGLSAVVEEANGHKSFWALAHPKGNPDFHQRDCFIHKQKAFI